MIASTTVLFLCILCVNNPVDIIKASTQNREIPINVVLFQFFKNNAPVASSMASANDIPDHKAAELISIELYSRKKNAITILPSSGSLSFLSKLRYVRLEIASGSDGASLSDRSRYNIAFPGEPLL